MDMKKIIRVCLVLPLLVACVSCIEQTPTLLENHDYSLPETDVIETNSIEPFFENEIEPIQTDYEQLDYDNIYEYTDNDEGVNNDFAQGGSEHILYYDFVDTVKSISILRWIVGREEMQDFRITVLEPNNWFRGKVPPIYMAIQHFNISKEEFIEYNEIIIAFNKKNRTEQPVYEDWMIDALYHEDKDEMIRLLIVPTALYDRERVYTFFDVFELDEAEREDKFGLTEEEWDEYVLDVIDIIGDRTGEFWGEVVESLDSDGSIRQRGRNRDRGGQENRPE
jgi:hypothetical protein